DLWWPAYRRWFLRDGEQERSSYAGCLRAVRTHVPELVPAYEGLVELVGGGDLEARFLSLWIRRRSWRPARWLPGRATATRRCCAATTMPRRCARRRCSP